MTKTLILIRHGQSEWNLKNLFTGWKDPDLTEKGVSEAIKAGQILKQEGVVIDEVFTSELTRAQKTADLILNELDQSPPITRHSAINERDYGDLAGLNKDNARAKWGEEQVHIWRRSYDIPPPAGESLKDTVARVLPYYINTILPAVMRNQTTLVAAHGNSLRALMMALENISVKEIPSLELATGQPMVYDIKDDTSITGPAKRL